MAMNGALLFVLTTLTTAMTAMAGQNVQDGEARRQLLPTGKLRAGINSGNPVTRAVGADIAADLARRLGVDVTIVEYTTPGAVGESAGREWDIAFVAADPAREGVMSFTPAYMELEATYLVRDESAIRTTADVDRPGVKIATGTTSAYTLVLRRTIEHAELVLMSNAEAIRQVEAGLADAATGLRISLLQAASRGTGLRVLPDNIVRAQQAIAVPKGHDAALAYVTTYLAEAKKSGFVAASIARTRAVGASVAP